MRMRNELWQGNFGYWQSQFIHHHLLVIGYTAWQGYQTTGRGMVVCQMVDEIPQFIDWHVDAVRFHRAFVPQAQAEAYLQALELEPGALPTLLGAIATYDPNQALVVLVIGNGAVNINLLQNLAISPTDCYHQVQQRWAEFQPDLTTQTMHP